MVENANARETILKIVRKIAEGYRPKKIILFGSHAYGNAGPDSDVDLLIVKNTDKRPIDRWVEVKRLLRDTAPTVPVAPLVYTEKEIEERTAMRDFFLAEVLQKGEILYE